jgi:probable HAF family extracellular repeat protein
MRLHWNLHSLGAAIGLALTACSDDPAPTGPEPGAAAAELASSAVKIQGPIDLGTFGGTFSTALGINGHGQVVGYSSVESDDPGTALMWYHGGVTDLGDLGGNAIAFEVNDPGQVVGSSGTPSGVVHGFLWERGTLTDLGTLRPIDINNGGDILGSITAEGGWVHAALWRHGTLTDLGTLRGPASASYATAINDRGQAVGEGPAPGQPDFDYHAILWENEVMRDLGAWRPIDINNRGQILGLKFIDAFTNHVVLWDRGTLTDLGLDDFSPNAIDERGDIVGALESPSGERHAVLWRAGTLTELPTLGGGRSDAIAINARGQVVGTANNAVRESHAVLWEVEGQ